MEHSALLAHDSERHLEALKLVLGLYMEEGEVSCNVIVADSTLKHRRLEPSPLAGAS